jgi:hypothetical protein
VITRVRVGYFKQFQEQTFDLTEHVVLAGPNNSGKTTLLQAIVTWDLARSYWRGRRRGAKGKQRTGVPVTRKDFTAVPLREMSHLWTNGSTALKKGEENGKAGFPRLMEIEVGGIDSDGQQWTLPFEFRHQSSEQIYVKPGDGYLDGFPRGAEELALVHVPPFSGIGVQETRYDRPYQDLLIGQGKAGDILRNLLLDVHDRQGGAEWKALVGHIDNIFGVSLEPPEYAGQPYIVCDYAPRKTAGRGAPAPPHLDVACGGSGFHQVLLLLAFFYARPATVLLLDEPDAHLHVVLQKQVYDLLRRVAAERRCQLVIATHSEVLIDGTDPTQIVSFFGDPHPLVADVEREEVREAVRRLSSLDLLAARAPATTGILYVESESDFNTLKAWARILDHPAYTWFSGSGPFWKPMFGRDPREAKAHFFALRALGRGLKGLLLLDGDNRNLPDREFAAEGLEIVRWTRYEIESYLAHPAALRRFVEKRALPLFGGAAMTYLKEQVPPAVFRDALGDHDYWVNTPVSKTLLPSLFHEAGLKLGRAEYFLIADQMEREEVHPEVRQKLDDLLCVVGGGDRA